MACAGPLARTLLALLLPLLALLLLAPRRALTRLPDLEREEEQLSAEPLPLLHYATKNSLPDDLPTAALPQHTHPEIQEERRAAHGGLEEAGTVYRTNSFELDCAVGFQAAVRACAAESELVLLASNSGGLRMTANLALQLRSLRISNTLMLTPDNETCRDAHLSYPWLACGWSDGLHGFENYKAYPAWRLWSLWSSKWLLIARLADARVNVLALDADMVIFVDPYPLLRTPPLSAFELIVPIESSRINLGFMYFRGASQRGGVSSVLWDVVRRIRLFIEIDSAEWLLRDRRGGLTLQGLWDQGIFTDALESAGIGRHIYPYTYLASPNHPAWSADESGGDVARSGRRPRLGWPPANMSRRAIELSHRVSWMRNASVGGVPMRVPPVFTPHSRDAHFGRKAHAEPVSFLSLHSLDPRTGLAANSSSRFYGRQSHLVTPKQWLQGQTGNPARLDRALATPTWLYCHPPWRFVRGQWAASENKSCAVLHLVEMRSQFVHFHSNEVRKKNRAFFMNFYGHWLLQENDKAMHMQVQRAKRERRPTRQRAAKGAGLLKERPAEEPKVLRLPKHAIDASSDHSGIGSLLNLLQLLALGASLYERIPLIPSLDCNSTRWVCRNRKAFAGIDEDSVMMRFEARSRSLRCHLAMGGADCDWPAVLPAWRRLANLPALRNAEDALTVPRVSLSMHAELATSALAPCCAAFATPPGARPHADALACAAGGDGRTVRLRVSAEAAAAAGADASESSLVELDLDVRGPAAHLVVACWRRRPTARTTPSSVDGAPVALLNASSMSEHRLCSLPWIIESDEDGKPASQAPEVKRLLELRKSCPAYFALRGVNSHKHLDRMHRRRPVSDLCP